VSAVEGELVEHAHDGVGEPAGGVGRERRLGGAAEAREVDGVDAVALAQLGRGLEERGLRRPEAVQQQHLAVAVADGQRPHGPAGQADVVEVQQRRPAVRAREAALEADGQVEVAAGVEQALREGLDARDLTLAQAQPGVRVGADDHVRAPTCPRADMGATLGEADLPRLAHVAEADVVGGVEARLGAQIALRQ